MGLPAGWPQGAGLGADRCARPFEPPAPCDRCRSRSRSRPSRRADAAIRRELDFSLTRAAVGQVASTT